MEQLKTYNYDVQIRYIFSFIFLSGVLHAIILTLFILNTKNMPADHADESMFVYIVNTFKPEKVTTQKGEYKITVIQDSSKIELPAEEKRSLLKPAQNNPIERSKPFKETISHTPAITGTTPSPIQVSSTDDYRSTPLPAPVLQSVPSPESSLSGNSIVALSNQETSFQYTAELRETILAKIKKEKIYPVAARKLGIEGDVVLSFLISSDGNVHNVYANGKNRALSILEKAAVNLIQASVPYNVQRDRFRGKDYSIQIVISYKFDDVTRE